MAQSLELVLWETERCDRKIPGLTEKDLPALIAALGDKDEVVRLNAAYELGTIGAPAVPALIEIWQEASEDVGRSGSENGSSEHGDLCTKWDRRVVVSTIIMDANSCDLCTERDRGTGGARIGRGTTGSDNESIRASAAYALGDNRECCPRCSPFAHSRHCGMNLRGCAVMQRKH